MADLTQRQIKILKCITEEFIETADPVGSETLEKKYNLGISSATIRNEMWLLTQLGFLKKGHLSAGRSPTSMGLKYYVRNLMTPKNISLVRKLVSKKKFGIIEMNLKDYSKKLPRISHSHSIYGYCHYRSGCYL